MNFELEAMMTHKKQRHMYRSSKQKKSDSQDLKPL